MANVAHVGHAELLTPELVASQRFFVGVLGMTVVAESANAVYLRGYGQYQRTDLKLSAASVAGLGHLGLRMASGPALERTASEFEAAGRGRGWIDGDVGHGRAFRFEDPSGHVPGAPPRLHHLAFWVDTREEVLRAADVFVDHGVTIEVPPAQHGIGSSFFLYAYEPGGNRIEVTTGADFVYDPDPETRTWTAADQARGVGWGTRFPDSWRTYGTPPVESR